MKYFHDWNELEAVDHGLLTSLCKIKAITGDKLQLIWARFEPGGEYEIHSHLHEQFSFMIEGKMRSIAYFIPIAERKKDGWQVAIAAEDLPQYYETDYRWDCTHEQAVELAEQQNAKGGVNPQEAQRIIDSSIMASLKKKVPA